MQFNYQLSNFLVGLVVAQQKHKVIYRHTGMGTFEFQQHAQILFNEGLINSFTTDAQEPVHNRINTFNTVRLKYTYQHTPSIQPLIDQVYFYSSPSRYWFITYRQLFYLLKCYPTSLFCLSTPHGVVTGLQAISMKIGGLLLYRIN